MKFLLGTRRRTLLTIGGTIGGMIIAAAAVAYFSAGGSGTGTATVGTSTNFTITSSTTGGNLYPGGSANTVKFSVQNTGGGNQRLASVQLASIRACPSGDTWQGTWNGSTWTGTTSCSNSGIEVTSCEDFETGASDTNASDFWMPNISENITVTHGTTVNDTTSPAVTDGSLTMNDTGSNQDQCKNVNLALGFTSS